MAWTERTGLTSKQLSAILLSIITLIGGLGLSYINPNSVEYWFKSQSEVTRALIAEEIEVYIDQGLGGSPYQTEKESTYIFSNLTIGLDTYYYVLNGTSGKLWFFDTTSQKVQDWLLGNITRGLVVLKDTPATYTVGIPASVGIEIHDHGNVILRGNYFDADGYFLSTVNKTDIFKFPQQDYSYIVWKDGGNYFAKNGTTGAIDYSGVDAVTVINAALLRGSTYLKEGNYIVASGTVFIPSNTVLSGDGAGTILNRTSAENRPIVSNIDRSNGNSYVVVRDLRIDDSGTVGGSFNDQICLEFENVTHGLAFNNIITNSKYDGIEITSSMECIALGNHVSASAANLGVGIELDAAGFKNIVSSNTIDSFISGIATDPGHIDDKIVNNIITNSLSYGVYLQGAGTTRITVSNNLINVAAATHGIFATSDVSWSIITGNTLLDCNGAGIQVDGDYSTISSNTISNSGINGIKVTGDYSSISDNIVTVSGNDGVRLEGNYFSFTGNTVTTSTVHGVRVMGAQYGIVSSNIVEDNTLIGLKVERSPGIIVTENFVSGNGAQGIVLVGDITTQTTFANVIGNICTLNTLDGIELTSYVNKSSIVDNILLSNSGYGIDVLAATDISNIIKDNNLEGNSAGTIRDSGTTTIIKNNNGYITENSGTGSITSGVTTDVIAHGLSYTPSAGEITITLTENPTNTPGAIWVDTIGAANFTVNCENDPGASNLDFSWAVNRQ